MHRCPLFLLLALSACTLVDPYAGDDTAATREIVITTAEEGYVFSPDIQLDVVVRNASASPVYFDACGGVVLEEVRGAIVLQSWTLVYLRCIAPADVAPGEAFRRTFDGETLERIADEALLDESVRYRFVFFPFYKDRAHTKPLKEKNRYSNRFVLSRCATKVPEPERVGREALPPASEAVYYLLRTGANYEKLKNGPEPVLRTLVGHHIALKTAWYPVHASPCMAPGAVEALVVLLKQPDAPIEDFGFVANPPAFYAVNCGIEDFEQYRFDWAGRHGKT